MGLLHRWLVALACCAALGIFMTTSAIAAEAPPFFTQFPEAPSTPGPAANQLAEPYGVATSPSNRHIYVAETVNRRVSEYTAWGEFVRAFGSGVRDGAAGLQTCTTATGCLEGNTGSGSGEFGGIFEAQTEYQGPTGIAVDSTGAVYVMDLGNFRVQKFDATGNFILMFGGKVNQTTNGNVCTQASGNICKAGVKGPGNGEFSIANTGGVRGDYLTVGPDDTVYVGDKDRIQAFNPNGTFKSSIPLPEPGNPGSLDVDPTTGDLYFGFAQEVESPGQPTQPNVYRLDSDDGQQIGPALVVAKPNSIAVAPTGEVFVSQHPPGSEAGRILMFDNSGSKIAEFGQIEKGRWLRGLSVGLVGNAPSKYDVYSTVDLFGVIGAVRVYGAVPEIDVVGNPPAVPPVIAEQFASAVDDATATLRARINPKFWTDTSFYLEYGTDDCSVIACTQVPAPPGLLLTEKATSEPVLGEGITVTGLQPETKYHYRFVAESSGGGPVVGADRTFTTTPSGSQPLPECPANEAFRLGTGALLPDCRAYEMVSPVDKNNSDIVTILSSGGFPASLNKSAEEGGRLTYSAYKSFGEAEASPYSSQYLTVRGSNGWSGASISPPRQGATLLQLTGLDVQFKYFDEKLCGGYFLQDTVLSLAPEAVPDYPNLYRSELCAAKGYEAITRSQPPERSAGEYRFELQGIGGGHTVFRANDSLIPGVAPLGEAPKVYDYFKGGLAYVCVLPNGTPLATGCSVGTSEGEIARNERRGWLANAVSANGSRIYWSASANGLAKLYMRETAGSSAATIAVSKGPSQFWGASTNGGRVIFTEGSNLVEFEPEKNLAEQGTVIAGGVYGVAAMSADARRVYFASSQVLDSGATAGKPNLYLHEAGVGFEFIATLGSADVGSSSALSSLSSTTFRHTAKATPDGRVLAFMSSSSLTGQDNIDVNSGKADAQVFIYEAGGNGPQCVSCNRTGARPLGRGVGVPFSNQPYWAAALLPAPINFLYQPRVVSADGKRVYFNSFDSLVLRDTNGTMDVYQWEAEGKGDCDQTGGCVSLISSGESAKDSEFVDASADGTDVFFATNSSLVPWDPGLIDIYDARVGGGFPSPPPPPVECQGEACQNPPPPPNDPSPSSAVHGPGNVKPSKPKSCPKGKHKVKKNGKTTCVKNKGKGKSKNGKQSKNGRAGR